jgi:hypothetical protein
VLAEARTARAAIASPALLDIVRACLEHAADISRAVRSGGAHVTVERVRRADTALADLTRTMLKLAAKSERLASSPAAQGARSYRSESRAYTGAVEQLRGFTSELGALLSSAEQVRTKDAAGPAAAALLVATTRLTNTCASALGAMS